MFKVNNKDIDVIPVPLWLTLNIFHIFEHVTDGWVIANLDAKDPLFQKTRYFSVMVTLTKTYMQQHEILKTPINCHQKSQNLGLKAQLYKFIKRNI